MKRQKKNSFLDILMSVGIVDVDVDNQQDSGVYMVHGDYNDKGPMDDFIRDIIVPRLFIKGYTGVSQTKYTTDGLLGVTKGYLRTIVDQYDRKNVMNETSNATKVELWAKNGSYHNVLLCRLFGGMMNMQSFFKKELGIQKVKFRDLNELAMPVSPITSEPKVDEEKLHNSFYDACYQAEVIRWVEANAQPTMTLARPIRDTSSKPKPK
jgi:hypothetical protein